MMYHVKRDKKIIDYIKSSRRNDVKSIMFLSKMLFEIESRYWSTKLEMIALV